MKALFAHDHVFFRNGENYFSNGGLSGSVLSRYVRSFGELTVLSRQVVMSAGDGRTLTLASSPGVSFCEIPNFKSISNLFRIFEAKEIIDSKVRECDCLIARLPSAIGSIAVDAAIRHNKPYLVEVVGCAWDANINHGSPIGKIVAPFQFIAMRRRLAKSPYVIYITKEFLQRRYPGNKLSTVCPNVNVQPVPDVVLERRIARIHSQKTRLVFGLIGSMDVDYKGHADALRALARIQLEIPEFEIRFLGGGNPERWRLMAQRLGIGDRTFFSGTLPAGDAVNNWIDSVDVMLQPSTAEAQGRSIIEGMSRACPVISTRVGGIVELIDRDWLVKPGAHVQLALAIKALIRDKNSLLSQASHNFLKAAEYFAPEIERRRTEFFQKFANDASNIERAILTRSDGKSSA